MLRIVSATLAICTVLSAVANAQDLKGPVLGAASNFGQSWYPEVLKAAKTIPVQEFRDEFFWTRIEPTPGAFRFDEFTSRYPQMIAATGASMSVLVAGVNPAYDHGTTPYSAAGLAAFGAMAARVVREFPAITSVEVGNEFNSQDFVSGPVADTDMTARAAHYVDQLKSVHAQVKAVNPDIRILGGATLAIPLAYLQPVFALGGGEYMDALALHPYTTSVEQLARQIALVRRIPQARRMPIEITEFGSTDPVAAPAKLLKGFCQMALAGVTRLVWYPLSARGDGLAPLIDGVGGLTDVGRSYQFIQQTLVGRNAGNAAPDPFTYACRFDETHLVIWGEPRAITLSDGFEAFDATGLKLVGANLMLSMEHPLVIIGDRLVTIGENVLLSAQTIVADSMHQYAYPQATELWAASDPFRRFTRSKGREIPMVLSPGQERPATLWTPSLADPGNGNIRLTDSFLRPDGTPQNPVEVVHRYTADRQIGLTVKARWTVRPDQGDGVAISVTVNGHKLATWLGNSTFEFSSDPLTLNAGDQLEFSVGPNGSTFGALTEYRITLHKGG